MIVMGLDLSLAATGVAWWTPGNPVQTITLRTAPDGLPAERHSRILRPVWAMLRPHLITGYGTALVVVEGRIVPQGPDGRVATALDLAELRGVAMYGLHKLGIPAAVVPPPSLKKYATGKHNANKTDVVLAAERRLGRLVEVGDDNQADALWLLAMGLHHYGLPLCQVPVVHAVALDRIQWPPWRSLTDQDPPPARVGADSSGQEAP